MYHSLEGAKRLIGRAHVKHPCHHAAILASASQRDFLGTTGRAVQTSLLALLRITITLLPWQTTATLRVIHRAYCVCRGVLENSRHRSASTCMQAVHHRTVGTNGHGVFASSIATIAPSSALPEP